MNTQQNPHKSSRSTHNAAPLGYKLSRVITEEEIERVSGACDVSGVTVGGTFSLPAKGKVQADSVDFDGGGGCR